MVAAAISLGSGRTFVLGRSCNLPSPWPPPEGGGVLGSGRFVLERGIEFRVFSARAEFRMAVRFTFLLIVFWKVLTSCVSEGFFKYAVEIG